MGTYTLIIILTTLVILSYLFDLLSRKTRFPSVLLLLFLGIGIRQIVEIFRLPALNYLNILPTLGTIGIILIILEGALELKYDKRKNKLIRNSFFSALIILLVNTGVIALIIQLITKESIHLSILNAIPFSVISSSIAIPSTVNLDTLRREFVVYESTFSDVLGILIFNFFLLNDTITFGSVMFLTFNALLITLASVIFCLFLIYIIGRIKHRVKFFLILAIIVLVYSVGRVFHLPSLLIVFAFGLFMNNADQIKSQKFRKNFMYPNYKSDLERFYDISAESAFLIRTFFFVIFGFIISLKEFDNRETIVWGIMFLMAIYFTRAVYLLIMERKSLFPELFITPRGLITILMYLSLAENQKIPGITTGLLFVVILGSNILMSLGLITAKRAHRHLS